LAASLIAAFGTGMIVLVTIMLFAGLVSGVNRIAAALEPIASFLEAVGRLLPG